MTRKHTLPSNDMNGKFPVRSLYITLFVYLQMPRNKTRLQLIRRPLHLLLGLVLCCYVSQVVGAGGSVLTVPVRQVVDEWSLRLVVSLLHFLSLASCSWYHVGVFSYALWPLLGWHWGTCGLTSHLGLDTHRGNPVKQLWGVSIFLDCTTTDVQTWLR